MIGVILLLIALTVVVAFAVWFALQLSTALQALVSSIERTVSAVETVHSRDMVELSAVIDRLMARDLDHFKVYDLAQGVEVEEITPAERERQRPWLVPHAPEEESSPFREDHERRYGAPEEESDVFDPEKEGLPR